MVVFGSTSALCAHPDLPELTDAYVHTLDADFILDPWDEAIGEMLDDALGSESLFFANFKYHIDISRPDIFANFPPDFRSRLVPLRGVPDVWAVDPHDMAVAKLWVGRAKDVRLIAVLLATGRIQEALVRRLLWETPMEEKWIVRTHRCLDEAVEAAKAMNLPSL